MVSPSGEVAFLAQDRFGEGFWPSPRKRMSVGGGGGKKGSDTAAKKGGGENKGCTIADDCTDSAKKNRFIAARNQPHQNSNPSEDTGEEQKGGPVIASSN